jgi:hypothetical protein
VVLVEKFVQKPEPLDQRAWALQEKLLSARVLDYCTLKTQWICQEATDSFKIHIGDGWHTSDEMWLLGVQKKLQSVVEHSDSVEDDLFDANQAWWSLVSIYTKRKLTLDSDRMPAISALAQQLEKISGDKYVAGLWQSKILQGLCWKKSSTATLVPRPHGYQGPSWSWAAINGHVELPSVFLLGATSLVTLLDCQWHPKVGESQYGDVQSATVTLKGPLRPACWTQSKDAWGESTLTFKTRIGEAVKGRTIEVSKFDPDSLESEFLDPTYKSMPVHMLTMNALYDGIMCEGLVLRCRSDGKYSRVGYFSIMSFKDRSRKDDIGFLIASERQIITIV